MRQSRSCGFWLRNVAPLICSEGLSLTETKQKSKVILAPLHAVYRHQLPWGTRKNKETQRENLEGEGKGPTHSRFLAQEMLAMIWHLWICHHIHLCWRLLCWACWGRPCVHRSCWPGDLHPVPPPQPTPNTAAHPRTLLAMLKAVSPRKTIPPQNQWNVMFKSNNKACVYQHFTPLFIMKGIVLLLWGCVLWLTPLWRKVEGITKEKGADLPFTSIKWIDTK